MATISALGIGSGLDLNGLLDQLDSAERQKLAPITQQKNSYETKISAYGQVKSVVSDLQAAVAKLENDTVFEGVKSAVTGESVTVTTGANALPGTFQVEVNNLARSYSIATTGLADQETNLGAGSISFTLGDGTQATIDIAADSSSLQDIRNAINESDAGVQASIVNDGSGTPYRLVLAAKETGTDGAISTIDFGDLAGSLATDAATEITAQNASLTVNGISITSQSNAVEEAIQGVTLNLIEEGSSTVTYNRDIAGAVDAVEKFVNAYNKMQEKFDTLTAYNAESGEAGDLLGDGTLRSIQARIRGVLNGGVDGGSFNRLSDIGVTLELGGELKLDKDELKEIATNQPQALSDFFAGVSGGEDGIADKLSDRLDLVLDKFGLLDNATSALNENIKRLDQRYSRVESTIERTVERYRVQFGQLDSMIGRMNSTSAYLTQQFEAMNAQLNG